MARRLDYIGILFDQHMSRLHEVVDRFEVPARYLYPTHIHRSDELLQETRNQRAADVDARLSHARLLDALREDINDSLCVLHRRIAPQGKP